MDGAPRHYVDTEEARSLLEGGLHMRTISGACVWLLLGLGALMPVAGAETRIDGDRASGPHPPLEPQRLHKQWEERFGFEDCVWPTYEVRAEREIRSAATQFRSLGSSS